MPGFHQEMLMLFRQTSSCSTQIHGEIYMQICLSMLGLGEGKGRLGILPLVSLGAKAFLADAMPSEWHPKGIITCIDPLFLLKLESS